MRRTPLALIETVRIRDGAAPLWHLHLARLYASCRALGLPHPLELHTPQGGADRVHRIEASGRGGTSHVDVAERRVGADGPVRLVTSRRVAFQPYPYKTNERLQFERAAAEAEGQGADGALLLTREAVVAEGDVWTVLWWEGDRVAGPSLDLGILPSVARARIEELAGPVLEQRVTRVGFEARRPFVANAVRGVVSIARLDGAEVEPHPGTLRLAASFWA